MNKNFSERIPFSFNSQLWFPKVIKKIVDWFKIRRFDVFDSIWFYSTVYITVLLSIQIECEHDFPFANTMTTLWSRYIRRSAKISVYNIIYRILPTGITIHRVNTFFRSISGSNKVDITVKISPFLLFKILWHMQKSELCICIWPAGQTWKTNKPWCFTYDFLGKLKSKVNKVYFHWYTVECNDEKNCFRPGSNRGPFAC